MEKLTKNTIIGLSLIAGAVAVYMYNNKKGIKTVGVNAPLKSNFGGSGCSSCSSANGIDNDPLWLNEKGW